MLKKIVSTIRHQLAILRKCSPVWYQLVTGDQDCRVDLEEWSDDFSIGILPKINSNDIKLELMHRLRVLPTMCIWLVGQLFPSGVSVVFLETFLIKTADRLKARYGDDMPVYYYNPIGLESWRDFFSIELQLEWVEVYSKEGQVYLRATNKGMRHIEKLRASAVFDSAISPLGFWSVALGKRQDYLADAILKHSDGEKALAAVSG